MGGLQNTVTNLGASIGTALAGAVLIAALTTSFLMGIQHNPAVPTDVQSKARWSWPVESRSVRRRPPGRAGQGRGAR